MFYNLERAKSGNGDVKMFVASAYLKPALPRILPAATFPSVVARVANGQPLSIPKTKRQW